MSMHKMFTSIVNGLTGNEKEAQQKPQPLSIVICQDATSLHDRGLSIVEKLRGQGHEIKLHCVKYDDDLQNHLESLKKSGGQPPDIVMMDVGGVGERAALQVIKWFDKNHPDKPLPALNFMSLDLGMSITEAGRLRESGGVPANFIDPTELSWLVNHLSGKKQDYSPASTTFREFLNEKLGTGLPLDHQEDSYYADQIKRMNEVTNDRVIESWLAGKLPAETMLERMRNYSFGLATALRSGFYTKDGKLDGLKQDALFYGSAGFPLKGPAVFSLQDAKDYVWNDGEKPVLIMQSYDPAVVPLLASGTLGGLVVTSPYMASHLKLLCETHMVSGLFGMMPQGKKSLTTDFNEEAKPDLPPYFEGTTAKIAGQKVKKGQSVLLGIGGNGIVLNPSTSLKLTQLNVSSIDYDEKLRADIRALKMINRGFANVFAKQGMPKHGVKANIDSTDRSLLDYVAGIGLVRTEQLVAINTRQVQYLKEVLLQNDAGALTNLCSSIQRDYERVIRKLGDENPVKIRLFDFVHHEILNKDEQKRFLDKYGRLDIHGSAALATWPQLYRTQVRAIFDSLNYCRLKNATPLEIMMPSVRTEQDTLEIKKLIAEEARAAGIKPGQYSFGVMAETLESCENIGAIAKHCDFISFGTNDLTQQYFDMSRSDLKAHAAFAGKHGYDPFKKLSPEIFAIMKSVVTRGREANPALKVDVCGAQAADPDTALALFGIGVDNVSVAPNLGNLYGLPALLNYKMYDAQQVAAKPANANAPTA